MMIHIITAAVTAVISGIVGMVVRRIEKKSLRRNGELRDGRF